MALTEAQVQQYYETILQRPATDAQVAVAIATDQSADSLIHTLISSNESASFVFPILQVYQAVFGRVPDADGLDFWVDAYRGGTSLEVITQGFVNSVEFQTTYGNVTDGSDPAFINALYNNVLGRDGEPEGIAFWTAQTGINPADVVRLFAMDAEFTAKAQGPITQFLTDAANGVADYEGPLFPPVVPGEPIGETFTLTDAVGENIAGTANNDTFEAVLDDGTPATSTLNVGDRIDGAGGNDALNLVVTGAAGIPAGATVRNVETININATGAATLSAAAFVGANALWSDASAGALTLDNASLAATYGVRDTDQDLTVNITNETTGDDTVNIVLDGADGGTVDVTGAADGVEVINLTVQSDSSLADLTADALATLTISGSGDLEIVADLAAGLEAVNAGAATGDLVLNLGVSTVDVSVTTGSGNDTVDASSQTSLLLETTVDLGAGNDSFIAGLSIYNVDGGAGNDTINFTGAAGGEVTGGLGADAINLGAVAAGVTLVYETANDSTFSAIDSIAGFTTTVDSIDLSALGLTGDTTVINAVNVGGLQNGGDYFSDSAVANVTVGGTTYTVVDANNNNTFDIDGDMVILGISTAVVADFTFA